MFLYTLNGDNKVVGVLSLDGACELSADRLTANRQSSYSVEHPVNGVSQHTSTVVLEADQGCTFFLSELEVPVGFICDTETGLFKAPLMSYTEEFLLSHLAETRWRLEISGIEVNGHQIDTSRESQNKISAAYILSQVEPDEDIKFKTKTGYVTLTSSEFSEIALTVARYVRDLHNLEEHLVSRIKDGEITTLQEITDYMYL